MKVHIYPKEIEWQHIMLRPTINHRELQDKVAAILSEVRLYGDVAIQKLTEKLDRVKLDSIQVDVSKFMEAESQISPALKEALKQAAQNIKTFHQSQLCEETPITTMEGVTCYRKSVGIEKVGLYVPGGTAPLFSTVLMLAIPAVIAGCKDIVLCTPPDQEGNVHPAILYAAKIAGVTRVFKVGGAQAIAAMAYGTTTIPRVYKIFGPGNQFVTCAKQLVQMEGVSIDMPAGPSEVCVLADDSASAAFVAADLLSQAEHGSDSQSILVTTSKALLKSVGQEVEQQLQSLGRKAIAEKAIANSKLILLENIDEALAFVNAYAAEHLIIACQDAIDIGRRVMNAGSVFLGHYSPESVGDYASGTNHTLPTNGYATAYSGVSVDSFVKKITFQQLSKDGLQNIAQTVIEMAMAEGLDAHANAVKVRL